MTCGSVGKPWQTGKADADAPATWDVEVGEQGFSGLRIPSIQVRFWWCETTACNVGGGTTGWARCLVLQAGEITATGQVQARPLACTPPFTSLPLLAHIHSYISSHTHTRQPQLLPI